jgi:hypothetical protein
VFTEIERLEMNVEVSWFIAAALCPGVPKSNFGPEMGFPT